MAELKLTEAQFQRRIVEYARLKGWMVSHTESVTMTGRGGRVIRQTPASKGFPDLTLARAGQIWFLEVKTETNSVSADQKAWLTALSGRVVDGWSGRVIPEASWQGARRLVMVVRPRHWAWLLEALK